jgi:hypothetical protein
MLPALALLFFSVMAVLWAGTLFLQAYLYSEPVSQIYWRAPAAALALAAFLGLWCSLDYRRPQAYNPTLLFEARSNVKDPQVDRFWAVINKQEVLYTKTSNPKGRPEYHQSNTGKVWSAASADGMTKAIVIEEEGQKVRFNADLTPDGNFKKDKDGYVAYREEGGKGRKMTDAYVGRLEVPHGSTTFLIILLSLLHLLVWFLGLWLLLRFQWGHALGLAVVLWLVLTLTIVPMLFAKVENAAKEQAKSAAGMSRFDRLAARTCERGTPALANASG